MEAAHLRTAAEGPGPSLLGSLEENAARGQIREITTRLLLEESAPLSLAQRQFVTRRIEDEVMGHGPLEPLLADPTVSDILMNGPQKVYIERHGKLELTEVRFNDDAHLMNIIDRIVSAVGRRVDESSPMVDARLKDGSRVNVIIPPLALDGPMMSIRRFAVELFKAEDLIRLGTINEPMAMVLKAIVHARLNVVISGGTGAGKTTLLNIVSGFVPAHRARGHDRGLGRAPAPATPRRPPGDAPAQHRGQGSGSPARPRAQRAAHAAGAHHHRRGPRRRGPRHAPGHEHRPRRVAHDRPRQLPARRAEPHRDHGLDVRHQLPDARAARADGLGDQHRHPGGARRGRQAARRQPPGDQRHGGRGDHDVRDLRLRAPRRRCERQRARRAEGDRRGARIPASPRGPRHRAADIPVLALARAGARRRA